MSQSVPGAHEITRPRIESEITPPKRYRVLMHNDHYTTMDFVVWMLEAVFHKPTEEAERIMMQIHKNGIGVCGVYTSEVAETKIAIVHENARANGYPLKCSMEPE